MISPIMKRRRARWSGAISPGTAVRAEAALAPRLAPLLGDPHWIDGLSLMGEDRDGRFHLIRRLPLAG